MERVKELDIPVYFPGGSSKSKLYKSRKRQYLISANWGGIREMKELFDRGYKLNQYLPAHSKVWNIWFNSNMIHRMIPNIYHLAISNLYKAIEESQSLKNRD